MALPAASAEPATAGRVPLPRGPAAHRRRWSVSGWALDDPRAVALPLAFVLVTAVALRLPFLLGGQLDFDEGVYWESLRSLQAGHALFGAVYSSQPPAFLLFLQPFFALGHSLVAARVGVLVYSMLGIAATFQLVRLIAGSAAGLVAAAIMAIDPLALRQSVTLQADGPSVAFGMVALALAATAATRRPRAATLARVLAGVALGIAIWTKLSAVAFVPPILLLLLWPSEPGPQDPARIRSPLRRALVPALELCLGLLVSSAAILAPFAAHWSAMWNQVVAVHWAGRSLNIGGPGGSAILRELPLVAFALVGLAAAVRKPRRYSVFMLCWAASVAAVLASVHPLWTHDLVIAIPLLAVAASSLVVSIVRRAQPVAVAALAGAGLIAVAVVLVAGRTPLTTVPSASRVLASLSTPSQLVVSDDPFAVASANRDTPPALVDISSQRIAVGALTGREIESAIVHDSVRVVYFATGRLDAVPGLRAFVSSRFPRRRLLAPGAVVFSR
jgi:4-amino-4-deoxy-L-arabinose transferase-like glycosyltransferase